MTEIYGDVRAALDAHIDNTAIHDGGGGSGGPHPDLEAHELLGLVGIEDLELAISGYVTVSDFNDHLINTNPHTMYQRIVDKGSANGYASLDVDGLIPVNQIPAQFNISSHVSSAVNVHGITNTANLVYTDDTRLVNQRTPSDGSVTIAKIPDNTITVAKLNFDPATQAELNTAAASLVSASSLGVSGGVATLDGSGKLTTAQIPSGLGGNSTYVVASQAAMLALSASVGDWAIRTDNNLTYVLATAPPSTLGNWHAITNPSAVTTVNGLVGDVVIPVDPAANVGGSRTLGTGALQAAAGNDSRLGDARTPTAHTHIDSDLPSGLARDGEVTIAISNHASVTTSVHGITDSANLVYTDDTRLGDTRDPKTHGLVSGVHSASGLTAGQILRATGTTTFAFGPLQDTDIPSGIARDGEVTIAVSTHAAVTTSVHGIADTSALVLTSDTRLADTRDPKNHALVSSVHTLSGATAGTYLKATSATAYSFSAIAAADLPAHNLITSHTAVGISTGQVLRATGTTTFAFQSLIAADLPSHDIVSAHSASGLTAGQVLKASSATAYSFSALVAGDIPSLASTYQVVSGYGVANGYAPLNSSAKVPPLNLGGAGGTSSNFLKGDGTWGSSTATVGAGSITNTEISATAAIDESKLNLASDAAAGTASRRTLGVFNTLVSATAAAPANLYLSAIGAIPTVSGFGTMNQITVGATGTMLMSNGTSPVYVEGIRVVRHGATAGTSRGGAGGTVYWIGSATPTNAIPGDQWSDLVS